MKTATYVNRETIVDRVPVGGVASAFVVPSGQSRDRVVQRDVALGTRFVRGMWRCVQMDMAQIDLTR